MSQKTQELDTPFTGYQKMVMLILALLQFVLILDFMIIAPIGDILMKSLTISTQQFGWVVSSYAFSAAISGVVIAGFADKYDRKKLLLFFVSGFILGTLFCAVSTSYVELLASRIITGIFAGVTGSTVLAIVADLFVAKKRGRAMGVVQMGFALSQIAGVPLGIFIAAKTHWGGTFMFIVGLALFILATIALFFKPIHEHLKTPQEKNAFVHLWHTVKNKQYQVGFMATGFLTIGGFLLMPFSSVFLVNNVHIAHDELSIIFLCTGVASFVAMPLIGKLSDQFDRFRIFMFASIAASIMTFVYTHLPITPLWLVIIINMVFFVFIMSRMSPAMALNTMVPKAEDRGAYMSLSASLQQTAGGVSSVFAGWVVYQPTSSSPIEHFDVLGYIAIAVFMLCIYFVRQVDLSLKQRSI